MIDNSNYEKPGREVKGRGTGSLIKSRFEAQQVYFDNEEAQQLKTLVFKDNTRSIISYNESPDLGFNASINPYRGCEHGCIYCYARPTHEYFGLSSGLDFETKIFAKMDAALLLRKAFLAKSYHAQVLAMSGVTDCYQPIEKKLELSRQCLAVFAAFRNPVVIITKNHLVTRDIDILQDLAAFYAVHVIISITTLDEKLAHTMEPRASTPKRRLDAVSALHKANIPVSINMAPIIPGLTDHEIPSILKAAADKGACSASYTMVRLPYAVKDLFTSWLSENYPEKKNKILHRIQEMRQGKLNSAQFGARMVGEGPYAAHIGQMFSRYREMHKLNRFFPLSVESFVRASNDQQLSLL